MFVYLRTMTINNVQINMLKICQKPLSNNFALNKHNLYTKFYILLTVHHVMILGKWQTWRTIHSMYLFLFLTLYMFSSTSCSSSGETNCVNTTSGNCHSLSVVVSFACRKWTSDLHTTQPPKQSESYQRLYWYNLFLLMMSTMCSKHVKS